jgi:hypothetical protein
MTIFDIDDRGFHRGAGKRASAAARRRLAAGLAVAMSVFALQPAQAAEPDPVKIAVFDFQLDDRSAGGGIVDPDPIDAENLRLSTQEARRLLSESGRYSIIEASGAADAVSAAGGLQNCDGCEVPLAKRLGADQSLVGLVTRVSRTEYTLQIVVKDVQSGAVLSDAFSGLRMGANYAWPRGVKSLIKNRVLAAQIAE